MIDASVIARLIMREGNYVETAREIKTKTIMTFSLRSAPAIYFEILPEVEWRAKGREGLEKALDIKNGSTTNAPIPLGEQFLELLKVISVEALGNIRWHCLKRSKEKILVV